MSCPRREGGPSHLRLYLGGGAGAGRIEKGFTLRKTTFSRCCSVGRRQGVAGGRGDKMGSGISGSSFTLRLDRELEDNLV